MFLSRHAHICTVHTVGVMEMKVEGNVMGSAALGCCMVMWSHHELKTCNVVSEGNYWNNLTWWNMSIHFELGDITMNCSSCTYKAVTLQGGTYYIVLHSEIYSYFGALRMYSEADI